MYYVKIRNPCWLLIINIIFLLGCSNDQKGKSSSKTFLNQGHQTVLIKVTTDDPKALRYFNFNNYLYFKTTDNREYSIKKKSDTNFEFKWESIKDSQIMGLWSSGDSAYYKTQIYVRPGDSISMILENGAIYFEGKKAAQFNFFNQLDPLSNEWASIKFEGSLNAYKRQADSIYHRRQTFFNEYVSKHDLSKDFVVEVGAELKFEYLFNLMVPKQADDLSEYNFNKENIVHLIAKDWGNDNEILFDFDSYFEGVSITDFKRPELLSNDYFKRSLIEFIRYYFVHDEPITFSMDSFEKEKTFIEKHFEGGLEEFAITSLFFDYQQQGLGLEKSNNKRLKSILLGMVKNIKNPNLDYVLEGVLFKLNTLGNSFLKEDNNDRLTNLFGDTLTIKEILNKTPNRPVVLDFWASWCTPCIKEIKETPEFIKLLEKEHDVEWLNISIDAKQINWESMTQKLGSYLNIQNQYRITISWESELIKFLSNNGRELFTVPRYLILNSNHDIIYFNAPKPTDSVSFKKLIQKLKVIN